MNFDELKQQCLACQRCGLCETRTHVVFGQGVPDAEVLFVGEGPGANEDAQGLPCLGRIAAQQMIGKDFSVTRDHGKFFDKQGTLFMATLHPAALLRNPKSKISAFEDFVALREKIEQVCDHTYNRS